MRPEVGAQLQRVAILALILAVIGIWYVLYVNVINPPLAMIFKQVRIVTPVVAPGQHVTMIAEIEMRDSPECLLGTQRYVRYSDNLEVRAPGSRVTTDNGTTQIVRYDLVLPIDAREGQAFFQVKENFGCGVGSPVFSPLVEFEIRRRP